MELLEKQKQEAINESKETKKQADAERKQAQYAKQQVSVYQKEIAKLKTEKHMMELQLQEYRNSVQGQPSNIIQIPELAIKSMTSADAEEIKKLTNQVHQLQEAVMAAKKEKEEAMTKRANSEHLEKIKIQDQLTEYAKKLKDAEKMINDLQTKQIEQKQKYDKEISSLQEKLQQKDAASKNSKSQHQKLKTLQSKLKLLQNTHQLTKIEVADKLRLFSKQMHEFTNSGVGKLLQALQEASEKYKKETKLRKELYNELQDLKGNIRVYVRVRPFLENEKKMCAVQCQDDEVLVDDPLNKKNFSFEFEKVFGWSSTQQEVFSEVKPLATSVLDGYNVCIFAYGQTGSGKTFTMEGPEV